MELVVGRENSGAIQICYEDHGRGAPVVLVGHGHGCSQHADTRTAIRLASMTATTAGS